MSGADAVRLAGVTYAWSGSGFGLTVEDFRMTRGEAVILLGESGSGKSTLLSLVCGTLAPTSGRVEIVGQDLAAMRRSARDRFRAERIGVIFQMFNLLPFATGLENVLLPLRFAPARRARCGDLRSDAMALLLGLGLTEAQVMRQPAAALSVGQQQRVAVARAMIGQPDLIVADEPTSALDAAAQAGFLDLLFAQVRAAGASLLMVSHDDRLAGRFDREVRLSDIARTSPGLAA